jgi:LDH2 family malate/lactate/ureidoglycolate dehydrogenase
MIECLTSLAAGLPLIAPVLESGRRHHGRPINGLAAAIDISVFGDAAGYRDNVDAIARAITGLPKSEGVERIFAPGERGDAIMAERLDEGVPLPAGTVARLRPISMRLGLKLPGG